MKESTKDEKAMKEFKFIASTCKHNFCGLEDHEMMIADTHYKCHVIMENKECTVYKDFGDFDSYEVDSFNI